MAVGDEWVGDDHGVSGAAAGLPALWGEVLRARAQMEQQRHHPTGHPGGAPRVALVRALESYLGLIAAKGYPPPHALITELQMQRRIGPGA